MLGGEYVVGARAMLIIWVNKKEEIQRERITGLLQEGGKKRSSFEEVLEERKKGWVCHPGRDLLCMSKQPAV